MNTFLIIVLALLCILVVVSLVRGIVAFMQSTKIDLQTGESQDTSAMQIKQNKAMFARIKYQGLAVLVIAIILAVSR
ncbi:MAG: hypothetical protein WA908_05080 [Pontixanthobacter sp.]